MGLDPGIRSVAADHFGERDENTVSPNRQTAVSVMQCIVLIETPIGPSCPLVEMAHEQGGGFVSRSESGVIELAYLKRDGVRTLQRSIYSPA